MIVGDYYYMNAISNSVTNKWAHVTTSYDWIYFQLVGISARLILTDNYKGRSTSNAYYFYLGDVEGTQTTLYRGIGDHMTVTNL